MSTETSCSFGHLLQVSKRSLWSLILYIFFHDFIHVYSPEAGADNPLGVKFWCQQEHLVTSIITSKSILYEFFTILYIYIAPGQGQTAPRGQNFVVNRKALPLYPFVASVKEISLKSDFIQFFSWFNMCTVAPRYYDHLYNENFDFRRNFFGNRSFLMKIYYIITEFALSDTDDDSPRRNTCFNTFFIH